MKNKFILFSPWFLKSPVNFKKPESGQFAALGSLAALLVVGALLRWEAAVARNFAGVQRSHPEIPIPLN